MVLQKLAKRYGVELIFNDLTGTETKYYSLLQEAGFQDVEVITKQFGNYISWSQVEKSWSRSIEHPLCRPLLQLKPKQLKQAEAEYRAELQALVTEKGIWNDITAFFVFGRKSS